MAGYALESMRRIRTMREDRAGEELVAARRARDAAQAELSRRRTAFSDWERTKDERCDRIWATILRHTCRREQIDAVKAAVADIDQEGVTLLDAAHRAEEDLATREKEAETARGRYVAASRNHQKIEQHRDIWLEEEKKAEERRDDAEMEDFAGRRMSHDDDDSLD